MVQQSSNQGVRVPPLQGRVVAHLAYGLVPGLLAAAGVLNTEDSCQLDMLGDITEKEPHDFLGSQSPMSLLNGVSNSDSDGSVVETVISLDPPVRSAPLASPAVSSDVATAASATAGRDETPSWLAWEDPYSAVNLILAAQEVTERPPLADSPEFHPRSHAENLLYKVNAPFDPDQVWKKKLFPNGVLTREIDAFFNFICAEGVPLDYLQLFKKVQKLSMTTVAKLERKALHFPDDCYIVHPAQHFVERCFALVVIYDPEKQEFPVMIFDDYNESGDAPCTLEHVCKLDWIKRVYAVYRIATEVSQSPKKMKMPMKQ
ncbi:hypothetical protein PInf_017743 [Phytophthora infestans]|nr:hypothetical protein PInf_017743 [Phytophthora infestans]